MVYGVLSQRVFVFSRVLTGDRLFYGGKPPTGLNGI